ncbi:MAG: hypothetical protein ACRCUE_11860 [Bosea sp. (in: a-proteobacteria)]
MKGRCAPGTPRAGNTFPVQRRRNGARAKPVAVVAEDAAHDLGLGRVDLPFTGHRRAVSIQAAQDAVAIRDPAGGLAVAHAALETAPGLLC